MSPVEVHARVRAKLAAGLLPREDCGRTWAGPGTDKLCVACDEPIGVHDVEFECEGRQGETLRYHRDCFDCWDRERRLG